MRVILFPTDFSALAENAFVYAVNLAKNISAKIYVLHCYAPPVLSATHAGQPDMVIDSYQNLELKQFELFQKKTPHMKELAEKYGFDPGQMVFMFEHGVVSNVVNNLTQKEKIHLIVMGTHGQTGFLDRVIGTNTLSVMKSNNVPVLAIPPHAEYNGIDKVVFTTLFREKDQKPLREALIMASQVNATTDCIYVINHQDITPMQSQIQKWRVDFEKYDVQFKILDKIESVENTIMHYLFENNIDVIAVVKRKKGFFERLFKSSTTSKLALHTKIPIIVYHENMEN